MLAATRRSIPNNMLTPAAGFTVPEEHLRKYDVLREVIGTDPELTMTRVGERVTTRCRR